MPRPIPKELQKRVLRLSSAQLDLKSSSEAFRLFMATADRPSREHFFLSMVVSYARPFTQNFGIGPLTCEYPGFPDFENPDMNLRHHRLIDLRNQFASHSSIYGTRVALMTPGAQHEEPEGLVLSYKFGSRFARRSFAREEYAQWLHEAVFALLDRVRTDADFLAAKVAAQYLSLGETRYLETKHDDFWSVPPAAQSPD